jgi:vancomycin permeability regulator SanA
MKNLKRRIKMFILFLFFTLVAHYIYLMIDGLPNSKVNADCAVVLGNKVNEDGTLSKRLEQRVACSLNLYKTGRVKKIIVSGGKGPENFWEGDKMKEYLIKNNVPDSAIIVDNNGYNTMATVLNTIKLKDNLNFNSLIVVSQYFHITRTKMFFKQQGFKNVSGASPLYFELRDIYSMFREVAAIYTNLFKRALGK